VQGVYSKYFFVHGVSAAVGFRGDRGLINSSLSFYVQTFLDIKVLMDCTEFRPCAKMWQSFYFFYFIERGTYDGQQKVQDPAH
jgi:hypothetical protein